MRAAKAGIAVLDDGYGKASDAFALIRLLYKRNAICYSSALEGRRGEIGIHDRLKIYWGQLRKGSSPFAGILFFPLIILLPNISRINRIVSLISSGIPISKDAK